MYSPLFYFYWGAGFVPLRGIYLIICWELELIFSHVSSPGRIKRSVSRRQKHNFCGECDSRSLGKKVRISV